LTDIFYAINPHCVVKETGARWWTSATDQGCPGKMAWCGSGEMFSEMELGPIKAGSSKYDAKCVALMASKGDLLLEAASCSENNRPICEVIEFFQSFCEMPYILYYI